MNVFFATVFFIAWTLIFLYSFSHSHFLFFHMFFSFSFFSCFRLHSFSVCVVICIRQKSMPFSNRYGNAFASRNAILKSNVYVTNEQWKKMQLCSQCQCNFNPSRRSLGFCHCFFVLFFSQFFISWHPFSYHSDFFLKRFHVLLDSFLVFVALLHSSRWQPGQATRVNAHKN